ncbi:tyrosine-type recombinase/integrase [Planococcus rifietoensis]|uniref:tyrosine-type recombinase/integrase n=1 Tax=Planococcus rifietoensis TaxID=200991 RepID=UPI00384B6ED2
MSNDTTRLQNDLRAIITTMAPELSLDMLDVRLEEVLYRYEIQHKATQNLEDDLADKIDLFISSKQLEGLSSDTLIDYRLELGLFMRTNSKAVVQIQTPDIRKYLADLQGIETSTMGKKLTVLKSFFGWLVREEILLRDPTAKIKLPKKKARLPKSLSVQELEMVREACETRRERAIVEVLYSTGCRLSELANMEISRIDHQEMSTTVVGKGNKERKVYLTYLAMYHLERYLVSREDDCDYIFATVRKPIRQLSNRAIQNEINNIEMRCKLNKKMHPHTFRHTLAQSMLDNGATLEEVQHILGHSNISTTQVYAHVSEERKQQSHRRYA